MRVRNNTGYYIKKPGHYMLIDFNGNHMANVASFKDLERYGKQHGFFFKGPWDSFNNKSKIKGGIINE